MPLAINPISKKSLRKLSEKLKKGGSMPKKGKKKKTYRRKTRALPLYVIPRRRKKRIKRNPIKRTYTRHRPKWIVGKTIVKIPVRKRGKRAYIRLNPEKDIFNTVLQTGIGLIGNNIISSLLNNFTARIPVVGGKKVFPSAIVTAILWAFFRKQYPAIVAGSALGTAIEGLRTFLPSQVKASLGLGDLTDVIALSAPAEQTEGFAITDQTEGTEGFAITDQTEGFDVNEEYIDNTSGYAVNVDEISDVYSEEDF